MRSPHLATAAVDWERHRENGYRLQSGRCHIVVTCRRRVQPGERLMCIEQHRNKATKSFLHPTITAYAFQLIRFPSPASLTRMTTPKLLLVIFAGISSNVATGRHVYLKLRETSAYIYYDITGLKAAIVTSPRNLRGSVFKETQRMSSDIEIVPKGRHQPQWIYSQDRKRGAWILQNKRSRQYVSKPSRKILHQSRDRKDATPIVLEYA